MLVAAGCDGCGPPPPLPAWKGFAVEALPGWDGPVVYGDAARATIADVNGPGVALLDADGDGDLDLYVAQGSTVAWAAAGRRGAPDRFFLNDGHGRFDEATEAWGLDQRCWSQGVAVGDIEGDGDPDLFVACLGPDTLLANEGDRWTDVSVTSGVATGGAGWSTSAAFGDLEGDGDLDLYVARYLRFDPRAPPGPGPRTPCQWKGVRVSCGPEGLTPEADGLWINRGDGRFDEGGGLVSTPRPGYGLGVLWAGSTLVVANDSSPNFLFRAGRSGRLEETGLLSGISRSGDGQEQAGMGVAAGRLVEDGPGSRRGLDLLMTHFSDDHHTLYQEVGDGLYRDRTFAAGLGEDTLAPLGWGVGAHDFDLDGDEDVLVVHGHVYPQAERVDPRSGYAQRDHLWLNEPGGRLAEVGEASGLRHRHVGRAAAFGDVDGDGDIDAVVVRLDQPPALYRNRGAPGRHWARFRLEPAPPGTTVRLADGQTRTVLGGGSFQAASDPRPHFGLGGGGGDVRWTVTWPDGRRAEGRNEPNTDVVVSAPGPS